MSPRRGPLFNLHSGDAARHWFPDTPAHFPGTMHTFTAFEYIGSALGMIGAAANSCGARWARVTWPMWLLSNFLLIACTGVRHEWGICAMQGFYLFTTLNGLRRTFWPARAERPATTHMHSTSASILPTEGH